MLVLMKLTASVFAIVILATLPLRAQYIPASSYLQYPNINILYADSCAAFWLQTWDNGTGGFYTNVDRDGSLLTSWGNNKNMLTQSRNAYGLTRAFMLTGDTVYLAAARSALQWMYEKAWDPVYGGWYEEIGASGHPVDRKAEKTAFYQHYALLGIAAYYEATRDTLALSWLESGYAHLERVFWDDRSSLEGYYDRTDYRGENPAGKSFNATVDAITTHLLSLYTLTEDPRYRTRLEELARQIHQHLVGSMSGQAIGFVEKFDSDWNENTGETLTLMGHVLKAGWCLSRIHQLFPDTALVSSAAVLIEDVWRSGYDHSYGGPFKDYNRVTGDMQLWGLPDPAKAWWQMEQAIVAGLELYDITGEDWYLQMADETIDFYMRHFVDHTYGEVFADRTHSGGLAWNEAKGSGGKAGYHSIETGFYSYIYGSLFLKQWPFTLYYRFQPSAAERRLKLTPLAVADTRLRIVEVWKDGMPHGEYDAAGRMLRIPAGDGGVYSVTFAPATTGIAEGVRPSPADLALEQNSPNPFGVGSLAGTHSTALRFRAHAAYAISVYDMLGRRVRTLAEGRAHSGWRTVYWEGKDDSGRPLPTGSYFCRLVTKDGTQTRRMLLQR